MELDDYQLPLEAVRPTPSSYLVSQLRRSFPDKNRVQGLWQRAVDDGDPPHAIRVAPGRGVGDTCHKCGWHFWGVVLWVIE